MEGSSFRAVFAEVRACWTSSLFATRLVTAHGPTFAVRGGPNLLCFLATTADQLCGALCPHIRSLLRTWVNLWTPEKRKPASDKRVIQGSGVEENPRPEAPTRGTAYAPFSGKLRYACLPLKSPARNRIEPANRDTMFTGGAAVDTVRDGPRTCRAKRRHTSR